MVISVDMKNTQLGDDYVGVYVVFSKPTVFAECV